MGVAISLVNGKGYLEHNERRYFKGNVDVNRSHENIQVRSLSLEEAYQKYFGETVQKYNANQKRKDRHKTVEGYLSDLQKNERKKGAEKPFYETIVQIGDKNSCNCVTNAAEAEKAKNALLKYLESWEERNPNLKVFNATLHMDEATPHLHIDYIPIATGYKQGLEYRNSLTKALEQQGLENGHSRFNNPSVKWQEQERKVLSDIAKEYGFEIENKSVDRQPLSVSEYKRAMDDLNELIEQKSKEIDHSKKLPLGKVLLNQDEYERLLQKVELAQTAINQNEVLYGVIQDKKQELDLKQVSLDKAFEKLHAEKAQLAERISNFENQKSKMLENFSVKLDNEIQKAKLDIAEEKNKTINSIKLIEKRQENSFRYLVDEAIDLKANYKLEIYKSAQSAIKAPIRDRQYLRMELEKQYREQIQTLQEKAELYDLVAPYIDRAKELALADIERTKRIEIEKEQSNLKEWIKSFSTHITTDREAKGERIDYFVTSKNCREFAFSIYENGVIVDLFDKRHEAMQVIDTSSGKALIDGKTWKLSDFIHHAIKQSEKVFIDEKEIENAKVSDVDLVKEIRNVEAKIKPPLIPEVEKVEPAIDKLKYTKSIVEPTKRVPKTKVRIKENDRGGFSR